MFALVAGNEDLNDRHDLRSDPLIQAVVDRDRPLAAPSTLCRFENGMGSLVPGAVSRMRFPTASLSGSSVFAMTVSCIIVIVRD